MNTESGAEMQKVKKMDAVDAAVEHKIESIARAATCSRARQIMFEIKKSPVRSSLQRLLRLFAGKDFRLLLCFHCNDCPPPNLRNKYIFAI